MKNIHSMNKYFKLLHIFATEKHAAEQNEIGCSLFLKINFYFALGF